MEFQINFQQTVLKIGQRRFNMQAVPVVFSEPCKFLPAWGPRPSKQIKCIHDKKWFQRGVRLS